MSTADMGWNFDNSYARLPDVLFRRQAPVPVRAPRLVMCNDPLAESLGLDAQALHSAAGVRILSGNELPPGAQPLALAYAGHQFGHFTMLGDGRAIVLGEQRAPDGRLWDVQLKGSGETPFSRRGDGRAALGPMLREYIISEAMHALGIPTTRSLAVVSTGERVVRERPLPGAVLTRVAASHVRVGTFEYLAARGDVEALRALAEYVLERHYPQARSATHPVRALFEAVVKQQATLVAAWLHVGFVHGVMNTDNMAISGETIDYGPCAFLDRYDPDTVFSSIDREGRYAYARQPAIAQWNLTRFAETLLPLVAERHEAAVEWATGAVDGFGDAFRSAWVGGMRTKLGLSNVEAEDVRLAQELLECLRETGADYTSALRALSSADGPDGLLGASTRFQAWRAQWRQRLQRQPDSWAEVRQRLDAHNPLVIPRNHKVEEALQAAEERGDLNPLNRLVDAVSQPYTQRPGYAAYSQPGPQSEHPYRTFCGT